MKKLWRKLWKRPATDNGFVYYVKLKTSKGDLYKIGFTTKNSIEERFAYAGLGDEKLIEKVFFFTHREDAFEVEQKLHNYFAKSLAYGKYSNNPDLPLCNNGQGELYHSDILGLDKELYAEEEIIIHETAKESLGGCLMLMLILVGLVGVPLGGWGIPILIGAGFWYLIECQRESRQSLESSNINRRPKHPPEIEELVNTLSNPGT